MRFYAAFALIFVLGTGCPGDNGSPDSGPVDTGPQDAATPDLGPNPPPPDAKLFGLFVVAVVAAIAIFITKC